MRPRQLDIDLFDDLASRSGIDLISVFIPTHQRGRDVAQDPIRLKNQLSVVEDQLEESGWKPRQRSERLASSRGLLEEKEFWEHQLAGLGLYIDDQGEVTAVSIPVTVEPWSFVAQVFHMRHLVPGMGVARLPILVLTKKSVRLLRGTRYSIEELSADLPESFDDVNWFVDREKARQQHPDRVGAAGNRHGHEPASRAEEDRNRFLRAVSGAIPDEVLNGPLVVLGDDDIVERFRDLSDFETVSPKNSGVGAPDDDSMIIDLATPALTQIEEAREAEALKAAMDSLGVGQGTMAIDEALPGAVTGRISDLVLQRGVAPLWGRLDGSSLSVAVRDDPSRGDVDLLDRLVVEARKTGARITTVAETIDGGSFIATYRY